MRAATASLSLSLFLIEICSNFKLTAMARPDQNKHVKTKGDFGETSVAAAAVVDFFVFATHTQATAAHTRGTRKRK